MMVAVHLSTSGPANSEGVTRLPAAACVQSVWQKGWTPREVVASVGEKEGALYFSELTLPAL